MTLNSVVFIFGFLPILLLLYYSATKISQTHTLVIQRVILLIASFIFFSWITLEYIPFLLIVIVLNYGLARLIFNSKNTTQRRIYLALGIVGDVLALLYYKYFDFFGEQLNHLFNMGIEPSNLIQPLGISFLTFSLISYLVDVYKNTIEADKSLLNVSLWAMFFPKMTSGPIIRYGDMYNESTSLNCVQAASIDNIAYGVRRFVIGLGKKVIIADTLGMTVDAIFTAQTTGIDTPTAWLGIICYTFQIFFDFAGYSDMAIGIAALFGFRFKENFNYPYISKTIGEFWHRWHISLSTWLRDYVYFPLGGSRRGNVYVNLMIVFLVSGFWHGASWHYIAWGLWYGIFMILDRIYRTKTRKLSIPAPVLWFGTMAVVVLGWVFFRAEGMTQAIEYFLLLFGIGSVDTQFMSFNYYCNAQIMFLLLISIPLSTPIFAKMRKKYEGALWWEVVRLIGITVLFILAVLFMVNSTYSPFLYAQF